ncbi:MAG: hypothetical protein QM730_16300 [Anaerolineales bacterium]
MVWSDIICYDGQTVHRLWQENDKSFIANLDQISEDGGATWGKPVNVTDVNDVITPVTLAINPAGEFHMLQLITQDPVPYLKEYDLKVRDWRWNGSTWESQPDQDIKIQGEQASYSIAGGITASGSMNVSVLVSYRDLLNKIKNEIYSVDRIIEVKQVTEPAFAPVISNSGDTSVITGATRVSTPGLSPTSTPNPALFAKTPSSTSKNLLGVFLVVVAAGLVIYVFLKRTGRKNSAE